MKAKLTYFRASGKYYSDGEIEVNPDEYIHVIWEDLIRGFRQGQYPGLSQSEGEKEYYVLIDVPGHTNEHPFMFIPNCLRAEEQQNKQYHDPDRPMYVPLRGQE